MRVFTTITENAITLEPGDVVMIDSETGELRVLSDKKAKRAAPYVAETVEEMAGPTKMPGHIARYSNILQIVGEHPGLRGNEITRRLYGSNYSKDALDRTHADLKSLEKRGQLRRVSGDDGKPQFHLR